jgi:hypothetical protein
MNWITRKIFGNGHGTGLPYFNATAYWLVDTSNSRAGRFYTWIGGFGAQLNSFEWRCPAPGTRRVLAGMEFEVFCVTRGWVRDPWIGIKLFPLMWSVSWQHTRLPRRDPLPAIRAMKKRLGDPLAEHLGSVVT